MVDTVFTDFVTPVPAAWLNDVNAITYKVRYADVSGTADALVLTLPPPAITLADGTVVFAGAKLANTTTTPTLNVNGLGAKLITKLDNQPLVAGDISGPNHELQFIYNIGIDSWVLMNPAFLSSTATVAVEMAAATHAATSKPTPVDADELPLVDSAAANVLKKLTWANVKATLKTYFDTLYQAVGSYAALAGSAAQVFSVAAAAAVANAIRADQPVLGKTAVSASIATGFVTFGLQPCVIQFRNSDVTNGGTNTKFVNTALTLATDNIGASFGLTTAVQGKLLLLAIDNGTATPVLGVLNQAGGVAVDEIGVLTSTTAITGAVVSPTTVYTTVALGAGLYPYKVVGAVDITWTSGSGYITTPALVAGAGGQAQFKSASMVRLNTANGYGSTNTMIRRFTNIVINQGTDITYADSATAGASFTINTAGVYSISYNDQFNGSSTLGISLNSSQLTTAINAITVSDVLAACTTPGANLTGLAQSTVFLNAGSIIRAHAQATATGTATTMVQFTITGPF